MHFADMTQPDREISVEHKHEPPYFTFRSTIGDREELGHDGDGERIGLGRPG